MPPPFRDFRTPQHAKNPWTTFRRLLGLLAPHKRQIALLIPPLLLATAGGLVWPRILGLVIDEIGAVARTPPEPIDYRAVAGLLALGLAIRLAGVAAQAYNSYSTVRLSVGSVLGMRRSLFARLLLLPVAKYDATRHGEFMSRLTNDTSLAGDTLGQGILQFFSSCFTLVGTLGYMFYLSVPMTLIAIATIPLTYFMGRLLVFISRKLYRARQEAIGEINALSEEMISGQHTVQAFCREAREEAAFNALSDRVRDLALRAEMVGGVMGPVMNTINNLSFILVAAAGGWLAVRGDISVGVIIAFLLYAQQFGRPINEIASQFGQIQSAIAGAERVFQVIDEPAEADAGTQALAPGSANGALRFEHVDFSYVPGTPVLRDFSLDIPAGRKVALVGETGSRKTTVISLVARFYDPDAGRITLDGTDLREIPKRDLRRSLAIVLQDVHLFSGTVAENISFGTPDATRADIEAAARLANADAFIRRLPDGYDTVISQTDTALSQGQCQLLSIARAALSNPRVLILDEATSSVDSRTELHIQEAMARLLEGRTSIVIAHRLSTVRDADQIVVIDRGAIVGQGTHDELLASNAPYRRLCGKNTMDDHDAP